MAFDKVIDSAWLNAGLKKICDSIRAKTGSSANLEFPNEIAEKVAAIDKQEDLSPELSAQDSLIGQIMAAFPKKCKVFLIDGEKSASMQSTVTINGIVYECSVGADMLNETIEVDPGTEITLSVKYGYTGSAGTAINIDGVTVASGGAQTYIYTVNNDVTIALSTISAGAGYAGVIDVTTSDTEPEGDFTPTDSGGTTYKSKFADNNADLQKILNKIKGV